MNSKIDTSIIILTKNASYYIEEVLSAIFSKSTKYSFEVIIIDSSSKDKTLSIIKNFPVKLKSILPFEFNHGLTRNLGGKLAEGKYLVYLTQDAIPQEGWLDNLIDTMKKDSKIAGCFSRQIPMKNCIISLERMMMQEWSQCSGLEYIEKFIKDTNDYLKNKMWYAYFANTSSCINKEVWQKFPFRELDFAEDLDWANRVLQAGYKIVYQPASYVLHSHNYNFLKQLRQNFDCAKGIKEVLDINGYLENLKYIIKYILKLPFLYYKDLLYVIRSERTILNKINNIFYMWPWHISTFIGTVLGANSKRLPKKMLTWLSGQAQIKNG